MIEYTPTEQTTVNDSEADGMHVSDLLDMMAEMELQQVEADLDLRYRYERTMRLCDYTPE